MRKRIGISALALGAALAVSPAYAVDLNLGGDGPLVDLSTPDSEPLVDVNLNNDTGATVDLGGGSSPAVTVDTNTDSTSDVGIIDLGNTDATIDLNDGGDPNDVEVNLGGDDSNDVIVDLFGNPIGSTDGNLIELGEGGLVDLGGTDDEIEVNLGGTDESILVDLFGNGEDAVVDLDALGDDELVVDILDQQAPVPATRVRLPDTDGLGLGDVDVGDTNGLIDLDGVLGGDVIPDLFGNGGSVSDLANVDLGDVDLGNLPDIDIGDLNGLPNVGIGDLGGLPNVDIGDLGGNPGLPDVNLGGSEGDDGDDGDTTVVVINQPPGGNDDDPGALPDPGMPGDPVVIPGSPGTNTTTIVPGVNRATARTRVAQQNTRCFTPNDQQIANLVGRQTYTANGMANWQRARNVTLVPVRLCPEARVRVSEVTYGNANMAALRSGIAQSPAISAKLNGTGLDAEDVLAVDTKDGQLVVYVY